MIVCAGSGGVGKTTMAAALAVRASQLGRRTLVLTVDPAKRLATALGIAMAPGAVAGAFSGQETPVAVNGPGSLSAAVIDSKKVFDDFILKHAAGSDIASRIMKNRLYHQLSTTLAGSQEFTALERLLQAVESDQFDLVVLDTPPTKHAVDFLTAPQRINSLFQDSVTRWFMVGSEKPNSFFAGLVNRGTRTVLKSLEVLTGGQFIEELIDFFAAIRSLQTVLRDRSSAVEKLLTGEQARFVVVTSFDAAKLVEAKYLQGELARSGYRLQGVVINRAFPLGLPADEAAQAPAQVDPELYSRVLNFYKSFKDYYSLRYNLYEEFSQGLDPNVIIIRVPEYQRDVYGLADLEALAGVLGGKS